MTDRPCRSSSFARVKTSSAPSPVISLSRAASFLIAFPFQVSRLATGPRLYRLKRCRGALRGAQQDVRINETRSNGHLIVFLIDPFAGNGFWQGRNLVGELSQRVQPRTNLFGRACPRRCLGSCLQLPRQQLLDVSLDAQPTRFRLGNQLIGDLNVNLHKRTVTRIEWPCFNAFSVFLP